MLFYLIPKRNKIVIIIERLRNLSRFEYANVVNAIYYSKTHQYLILDLDTEREPNAFTYIYKYLSSLNVTKHMDGIITPEDITKLFVDSSVTKHVELEIGATIDVTCGSTLRSGIIRKIEEGYVYVELLNVNYPFLLKIEKKKLNAPNK